MGTSLNNSININQTVNKLEMYLPEETLVLDLVEKPSFSSDRRKLYVGSATPALTSVTEGVFSVYVALKATDDDKTLITGHISSGLKTYHLQTYQDEVYIEVQSRVSGASDFFDDGHHDLNVDNLNSVVDSSPKFAVSPPSNTTVDLMLVYTKAAMCEEIGQSVENCEDTRTNRAAIEESLRLAVDMNNIAFESSGILQTKVNIVHMYMDTDYIEGVDSAKILTHMSTYDDGYLDSIFELRRQYAADMVQLVTSATVEYCGLAYNNIDPLRSVSTSARVCLGDFVLSHELGKLLLID